MFYLKKCISIFLLAAMLTGGMISCREAPEKTTAEPPETVPAESESESESESDESGPETSDEVEIITFDGRAFNVLFRNTFQFTREITVEELTGEIINDSIYNRNLELEERYSVTLNPISQDEGSLNGVFQHSVAAQDKNIDLALNHMFLTASLATSGVAFNWHKMPNLNFDKPWWTSTVDELTVNGIMYVTASDYCLSTFEQVWCLFFNKQLMTDLGITVTPYDLVNENKWTIDNYYDMVKDVSNDLNGDGIMDQKDMYGFNSYGGGALAAMANYWWACGETISRFDENGQPYFAMESEKTQTVFEKMYALLAENNITHVDTTGGKDMIFWHNQALFSSMLVKDVELNRDKDVGYGLVPYPKYDEYQDKYRTLVSGSASLMVLPATLDTADQEFVGTMVEAFSAASYREVLPAYYETAIQTKFAQDETMSEMLELIRSGRVFNFGYVYDLTINRDILVNLIKEKKTDLASKIASVKNKTEQYYKKITRNFE